MRAEIPLDVLLRATAEDLARSATVVAHARATRAELDAVVERLYAHHRTLSIAAETLRPCPEVGQTPPDDDPVDPDD